MLHISRIFAPCLCSVALTLGVVAPAVANQPADTTSQSNAPTQKVNFSPLFIHLSDAMGAIKAGDSQAAKPVLDTLSQDLDALNLPQSDAKQAALDALESAQKAPSAQSLGEFSSALYALEKSVNPVDYTDKRQAFTRAITPAFEKLHQQLTQQTNQAALRAAYNDFNAVWLKHERIVRSTSLGHYGQIETSMALIRVAIESTPINQAQIQGQLTQLQQALDDYNQGKSQAVAALSLQDGIDLLTDANEAMKQGQTPVAQQKLGEFIKAWASFEGEVRTRDGSLYTQVESQIPLIMANADQADQQHALEALLSKLKQIDTKANYGVMDAALILLREGLEALLIVLALLTMLNATAQHKGKKWVYGGALSGLGISILAAIALQALFPQATAGASRELIEGLVGVFAVIMMLMVGFWLHSKSSVKSWNAYLNSQMTKALSQGSFVGLFTLSFLAVFREGAETILFYAGILPKIQTADFVLGIALALVILAAVAILLFKTSVRLPIPRLFGVLTWLIYLLGFKILGVSVHALQLNGYLPLNSIGGLPDLSLLGIYPTSLGLGIQAFYLLVVVLMVLYNRHRQ